MVTEIICVQTILTDFNLGSFPVKWGFDDRMRENISGGGFEIEN